LLSVTKTPQEPNQQTNDIVHDITDNVNIMVAKPLMVSFWYLESTSFVT